MSKTYLADLRDYIDALRTLGECIDVTKEVDWNLEMAAIIRRCYELGAPAPLFTRIKGIKDMGGYFGRLVEVVKCKTVDLEIPATSEIVIEGYLSPFA